MNTLYIIPDADNIYKSIEIADKYNVNFEYNDFFDPYVLDNASEQEKLINLYKGLNRNTFLGHDTLHGAFMDIAVFSDDRQIKKVSIKRIIQSIEIALKLNCKAVIFHTNYMPDFLLQEYYDRWAEKNIEFWTNIIKKYPDISIYIENMFDSTPYPILQLAKAMSENKKFGICLDCGHAFLSRMAVSEWFNILHPYIKHLHFSDNKGIVDMHLEIGTGVIDWNEINRIIKEKKINAGVLIEISDTDLQNNSIKYLKSHDYYPF